uniref:Unc-93 n=1 Tax=Pristionchus pacificus TaxID=54126 RepID=A0A2A6B5I2_PRIPA|eukprot:PDM61136.1 unc-93 [Pristionchus pacificus]
MDRYQAWHFQPGPSSTRTTPERPVEHRFRAPAYFNNSYVPDRAAYAPEAAAASGAAPSRLRISRSAPPAECLAIVSAAADAATFEGYERAPAYLRAMALASRRSPQRQAPTTTFSVFVNLQRRPARGRAAAVILEHRELLDSADEGDDDVEVVVFDARSRFETTKTIRTTTTATRKRPSLLGARKLSKTGGIRGLIKSASERPGVEAGKEAVHEWQSPAIQSLRKVSQQVLRKIGVKAQAKPRDPILFKHRELPEMKLEDVHCMRPKEYFQKSKWLNFRTMQEYTVDDDLMAIAAGSAFPGDTGQGYDNELMERSYEYDPYCPVHGSRRRKKEKGVVTVQSLISKYEDAQSQGGSTTREMIYSQEFIAKCIRKQKRAALSGPERRRTEKVLRKIEANLWIISLAFLFLFTAFHGLQNLQTSVNGTLGADSLAVLYTSLAISSLFVPSFMINRIGCKLTLIASFFVFLLYHIANFLPQYYSLIPMSILAGVGGACLWGAKCAYITECGLRYAQLNIESQSTVIVRFFGYFFMVLHLGQVIGNLLSSFLLTTVQHPRLFEDRHGTTCGNRFPWNETMLSEEAIGNLALPSSSIYFAVCAAYLACAIVAVLILVMFLNALHKDVVNRNNTPVFDAEILKLMVDNLRNVKMYLLVPLTIFNGLEQAFVVGLFTKAFIACGLGISQIGFVMTAFGVSDAVCSLVFGPLIKLFGRMPLFVFGCVINMLMICTVLVWSLNPADTMVFYVIAGVWGMADGVWNTQVNGIWVALVGRQSLEFAFASYRFWESLGLALGFLLYRLVTVEIFLLISFGLLLVGIAGYFCIELYDPISAYFARLFSVCLVRRKPALPGMMQTSMQQSLLSRSSYGISYGIPIR